MLRKTTFCKQNKKVNSDQRALWDKRIPTNLEKSAFFDAYRCYFLLNDMSFI